MTTPDLSDLLGTPHPRTTHHAPLPCHPLVGRTSPGSLRDGQRNPAATHGSTAPPTPL